MSEHLEKQYDQLEAMRAAGLKPEQCDDPELAKDLQFLYWMAQLATERQIREPGPLFTKNVMGKVKRKGPVWPWLSAVAAALLVAFFLFRSEPQQAERTEELASRIQIDQKTLKRAIEADSRSEMLAYLAGTEQLLLALREPELACSADKVDLAIEKEMAKELLLQQKIFASEMQTAEYSHIRGVFRQLEMILVDLNTLDGCSDMLEIQSLSEHIQQKNILTKLRLMAQEIQVS
ncbi:MAG: hypothetical protein KDC35_15125 [Acidobacteria bacterium]|nr:hypothetical protein [Acidobacteriota bacterium]